MTDVPDSLDQMLAAWNETDPGEVRAHLDRALTPQVRFVDPSVDIVGVEAFEANIHHVHEQLPGATYSRTSEIDHHHNHHRYHWAIHSGGELVSGRFRRHGDERRWPGRAGHRIFWAAGADDTEGLSPPTSRVVWPAGTRPGAPRSGIDYRGTTVIGQRFQGARLIRASAVTREQSRDSASAT